MFSQSLFAFLALFTGLAHAGTKIWDGKCFRSFNSFTNVSDFDKWSWSSEVGTYQWYIHGTQPTSHYLALDPTYKNPADTSEKNGLRMTIDSTATWNSQMERCELIPRTTENLGQGNLFYHFSLMHDASNPPDSTLEHQIFFFESHFTEMKYGVSPNPTQLEWHVSGQPKWSTPFVAGSWYNFAYDIDFSAQTVGLWASNGSTPLVKVMSNVAAGTSTNSEDFHVGVLRIVNSATPEHWYMSGVYIESGPITTSVGSGSSSSTTSSGGGSTTTAAGPTQTQWGQCGGTNYDGPTTCVSPFTCKAVSPPYYYQCQ